MENGRRSYSSPPTKCTAPQARAAELRSVLRRTGLYNKRYLHGEIAQVGQRVMAQVFAQHLECDWSQSLNTDGPHLPTCDLGASPATGGPSIAAEQNSKRFRALKYCGRNPSETLWKVRPHLGGWKSTNTATGWPT